MADSIGQNTSITLGLLATVGGFIIGGAKWVIGIRHDLDKNMEQIKEIKKQMDDDSELHASIRETLSEQVDRMARVETKIDLLIQKKIK